MLGGVVASGDKVRWEMVFVSHFDHVVFFLYLGGGIEGFRSLLRASTLNPPPSLRVFSVYFEFARMLVERKILFRECISMWLSRKSCCPLDQTKVKVW